MKARHKRFMLIGVGLLILGGAAALVLSAFEKNLVFFFSPTQVVQKEAPIDRTFRVGGLVKEGSVERLADGLTVRFVVTDTANDIPVNFKGPLPDLFREGKGVVTQGKLSPDGMFTASEVLAKHDENYMPPEAQEAVEKAHEAAQRAQKSMKMPNS